MTIADQLSGHAPVALPFDSKPFALLERRHISTITGLSTSPLNKAGIYRDDGSPFNRFGRRCLYPIGALRAWMLERIGNASNEEGQP